MLFGELQRGMSSPSSPFAPVPSLPSSFCFTLFPPLVSWQKLQVPRRPVNLVLLEILPVYPSVSCSFGFIDTYTISPEKRPSERGGSSSLAVIDISIAAQWCLSFPPQNVVACASSFHMHDCLFIACTITLRTSWQQQQYSMMLTVTKIRASKCDNDWNGTNKDRGIIVVLHFFNISVNLHWSDRNGTLYISLLLNCFIILYGMNENYSKFRFCVFNLLPTTASVTKEYLFSVWMIIYTHQGRLVSYA